MRGNPAHPEGSGHSAARRPSERDKGAPLADSSDRPRSHDAQTVSLRRPLSRLARRIALPPLVAIRARNPWVLARLRVFGWYVRFTFDWPFVVPRRRGAVARDAARRSAHWLERRESPLRC